VAAQKPAAVLVETVSNPLLRVAPLDRIGEITRGAGVPLVVDNTFATPLLVQPLALGANVVVHSATKYLAGHGDVLGGVVAADAEHLETIIQLMRTVGPVMSPFESYLTMRGIKTLALRFERQCANAVAVAAWLRKHPRVARVYFPDCPQHPDRATIDRLFPPAKFGAMVSVELRDAGRDEVLRFMDRLRMVVRTTSLGDVHTMVLYPAISSHRDLAPAQRRRLGIGDGLVRLSAGIEAPEDILADLAQALAV
jgi:cystathionine gamma-synthase/methionine-gamma-lyase